MERQDQTGGAARLRRLLARAISRATLPYLLFGLLLLLGIAAVGYELERHVGAIEAWLDGLGGWGPAAFIGLVALATTFLVPVSILAVLAGALFGLGWGVAIAAAGVLLAAVLQFALARRLLRARITRLVAARPSLAAIQAAVRRKELRLQVLLRLTPLNPTTVTYLLGAAGVRFPGFAAALLATLPNLALEVYFGHAGRHVAQIAGGDAAPAHSSDLLVIGGLAACIVVMALLWRSARRAVLDAVADAPEPERADR